MGKGIVDNGLNVDTIKRTVSIRSLFAYFGIEIDSSNKALCPFHRDRNPSMLVNDEFAYCFACGRGWDLLDFLIEICNPDIKKYGVTIKEEPKDFVEALNWLKNTELPTVVSSTRSKGEYRGPVNSELIDYWHSILPNERRKELHRTRLFTDDTIDLYRLGWRPDWNAHVIPFWSGQPGQSEITIVQFRMTEDSPPYFKSKYIGLSGHNKPSMIGTHTLQNWGVLLFSTYDAILAGQDHLPAISPNGVSVFSTKKMQKELNAYLNDLDVVYAVRETTSSEWKTYDKVVKQIEVPVIECTYPEGDWTDYCDYRQYKSADDFMIEVLGFDIV